MNNKISVETLVSTDLILNERTIALSHNVINKLHILDVPLNLPQPKREQ